MKTTTFHENPHTRYRLIERRRKRDWVVSSVSIIAAISWFCAGLAWAFIDQAKPATANFFTRFFNTGVRSYWDFTYLSIGVGVLAVSFAACVIGFFLNMRRHRRKTDRYNKSILILGAITFIMLIIFVRKLIWIW